MKTEFKIGDFIRYRNSEGILEPATKVIKFNNVCNMSTLLAEDTNLYNTTYPKDIIKVVRSGDKKLDKLFDEFEDSSKLFLYSLFVKNNIKVNPGSNGNNLTISTEEFKIYYNSNVCGLKNEIIKIEKLNKKMENKFKVGDYVRYKCPGTFGFTMKVESINNDKLTTRITEYNTNEVVKVERTGDEKLDKIFDEFEDGSKKLLELLDSNNIKYETLSRDNPYNSNFRIQINNFIISYDSVINTKPNKILKVEILKMEKPIKIEGEITDKIEYTNLTTLKLNNQPWLSIDKSKINGEINIGDVVSLELDFEPLRNNIVGYSIIKRNDELNKIVIGDLIDNSNSVFDSYKVSFDKYKMRLESAKSVGNVIEAKRILLNDIVSEIPKGSSSCYFCSINRDGNGLVNCTACKFGKKHGVCDIKYSDYDVMKEKISELGKSINNLYKI